MDPMIKIQTNCLPGYPSDSRFLISSFPGWLADHLTQPKRLDFESYQELHDGQRFFEEQALLKMLD